jgi:hypothetical protein
MHAGFDPGRFRFDAVRGVCGDDVAAYARAGSVARDARGRRRVALSPRRSKQERYTVEYGGIRVMLVWH